MTVSPYRSSIDARYPRVFILFSSALAKESKLDGRIFLVILLAVYFLTIAISSSPYDTWASRGVLQTSWPLTNEPIPFGDLYHVLSCGECNQLKYNVYLENPCDPLERLFMYPRIWLLPAELGFNRNHSAFLGFGLALIFFITFLRLIQRLNYVEALLYGILACSPAVILEVHPQNRFFLKSLFFLCESKV